MRGDEGALRNPSCPGAGEYGAARCPGRFPRRVRVGHSFRDGPYVQFAAESGESTIKIRTYTPMSSGFLCLYVSRRLVFCNVPQPAQLAFARKLASEAAPFAPRPISREGAPPKCPWCGAERFHARWSLNCSQRIVATQAESFAQSQIASRREKGWSFGLNEADHTAQFASSRGPALECDRCLRLLNPGDTWRREGEPSDQAH